LEKQKGGYFFRHSVTVGSISADRIGMDIDILTVAI